MDITPTSLRNDPSQFLFAFDFKQDAAQILDMPRESIERSIFLDGRISRGKREVAQVPIPQLLGSVGTVNPTERPCGYIFHIAQCGSTLLARALEGASRCLSLREPYALRQLGVIGASGESTGYDQARHGSLNELIRFALAMFGKRWDASEAVIIKANVPVNFIADRVLEFTPDSPAIVLYFTLQEYLGAVLRTEGHEKWVDTVYEELNLDRHELIRSRLPQNTAERAAALWLIQMLQFDGILGRYPNVHSLDAAQFLNNPLEAIESAAKLMDITLTPEQARELVASDLFTTYSKNPTLDYDSEVRIARSRQTFARKAQEIDLAFAWIQQLLQTVSLPRELAKPLCGRPVPLLAR